MEERWWRGGRVVVAFSGLPRVATPQGMALHQGRGIAVLPAAGQHTGIASELWRPQDIVKVTGESHSELVERDILSRGL